MSGSERERVKKKKVVSMELAVTHTERSDESLQEKGKRGERRCVWAGAELVEGGNAWG